MPDLSDSINKIYQLLHKDPDYQDTPTSTREEQIWGEATQRAKQHERNNIALSLAKSSAVGMFADFLLKKKRGAPRVGAEALRESFNPKQGPQQFLSPLKDTSALNTTTKNIANVVPFFIQDLRTILMANKGWEDKFNAKAQETFWPSEEIDGELVGVQPEANVPRINISDAMDALEQRMILLGKFMKLEGMVTEGANYNPEELKSHIIQQFEEVQDPEYADPAAIDALLAPVITQLEDEMLGNMQPFNIVQDLRMQQAEVVSALFTAFPPLKGDKWADSLSLEAQKKYSGLGQPKPPREGQLYEEVDGELVQVEMAKAILGLQTPESAEHIRQTIDAEWGGLSGAATNPLGRIFLTTLKGSGPGNRKVLEMAQAGFENPTQRQKIEMMLGADVSDEARRVAASDYLENLIHQTVDSIEEVSTDRKETNNKHLNFLMYLAEEVNWKGGDYTDADFYEDADYADEDVRDEDEDEDEDEMARKSNVLIPPSQIVPDSTALNYYIKNWPGNEHGVDESESVTFEQVDPDAVLRAEQGQTGPSRPGEPEDPEMIFAKIFEQQEGMYEDADTKLASDAHNAATADSIDNVVYRADWDETDKDGWLGDETLQQALIDGVNKIYDYPGVTEVFLYGDSVDDLQSTQDMADDATIKIGIKLNPDVIETGVEEIQNNIEEMFPTLPNLIDAAVFKGKGYSQALYTHPDPDPDDPKKGAFGKTVVFYEHDPISVEAGGTPTFPKAEDALMSQFEPILGTDLVGGHGSQQPVTIDQKVLDGDMPALLGKTEGARIAIEPQKYRIPPLLAYRTANIHPEIAELRDQVLKFRGVNKLEPSSMSMTKEEAAKADSKIEKWLGKTTVSGRGGIPQLTQGLGTLQFEGVINPAQHLNDPIFQVPEMVDSFFPRMPVLLDNMGREELAKLTTEKGLKSGKGGKGGAKEKYETAAHTRGTEEYKEYQPLYAARREQIYEDIIELLPGEATTKEDLLASIPTLISQLKEGKGKLDVGERDKLAQSAFGYGDKGQIVASSARELYTHEDLIGTIPTMEETVEGLGDTARLQGIDPLVLKLFKPKLDDHGKAIPGEFQIDMSVRQPSLKDFHELVNNHIRDLVEKAQAQTFEHVRHDIVYYDGEGRRKVLAIALPSDITQLSHLEVEGQGLAEDQPYVGNDQAWTLHRPDLAPKGELMGQAAKKAEGAKAAFKKHFNRVQEVLDADPKDKDEKKRPQALFDKYFDEVPDTGSVDSIRDAQGVAYVRKTGEDMSLEASQNLFHNHPNLRQLLIEHGILPTQYPRFSQAPALAQTNSSMGKGLENLLNIVTRDQEAFSRAFDIDQYRSTPQVITEAQREVRKKLLRQPLAVRDAIIDGWDALVTAPGDFKDYGIDISRDGNNPALQMVSTLITNLHAYKNRELSKNKILPIIRTPTTTEQREYERMIDEHREYERQKPLPFDETDTDFQGVLKFLIGQYITDEAYLKEHKEELGRNAPHKSLFDSDLREEVDVPIMDGKSLSLVRTAFENTFKTMQQKTTDPLNQEQLIRMFERGVDNRWMLFNVFKSQYDNIMTQGDAASNILTDRSPKIRVYSDADALANQSTGSFDVPDEYLDRTARVPFTAQYTPLLKLAKHLGYPSVIEMLRTEHVLLPEPEFTLGDNNEPVGNPKYRGGRAYRPIEKDALRIFLHKMLANSHYAEDQKKADGRDFLGKHKQHYIDDDLTVDRLQGTGKNVSHKERPSSWVLGVTESGMPIIRKIHDDPTGWDNNLKGTGEQSKILQSASQNIARVGVPNTSFRTWGQMPVTRTSDDADEQWIVEPSNAVFDFKQLNDLLTKYNIGDGMQVPELTDATDPDTLNAWIKDTKQILYVLQGIKVNRIGDEGDQQLFNDYLLNYENSGAIFKAMSQALGHVTVGKGEKKKFQGTWFISPHADQEGQNRRLEAFTEYKNTPLSASATRMTQEKHEKHAFRMLQSAFANTQLNDYGDGRKGLKTLFGEHIHHHNKEEPLYMLVREINKIKARGQEELGKNPQFDYARNVNNAVNLALDDIWKLVGPNHPEIRLFWEGEGHRTPEDVIDAMPYDHVKALQKMKAEAQKQQVPWTMQLETWNERLADPALRRGLEGLSNEAAEAEIYSRLSQEDRDEIKDIHDNLDRLDNYSEALEAIPWSELELGRVPKNWREAFDAEIAKLPNFEPHFWQKGTATKEYFNRQDKSKGSFPWSLGETESSEIDIPGYTDTGQYGTAVTAAGLDYDSSFNGNLDRAGMGQGFRMVTADLNEDGVLDDAYANHYYIELTRGQKKHKKIVGHVVRDNGNFSIWRGGEYRSAGTHGDAGPAPNPSRRGEFFEPLYTDIAFENLAEKLKGTEFTDPALPDNNTGTEKNANTLIEAVKSRTAIPIDLDSHTPNFAPEVIRKAEERGLTDHDMENLAKQHLGTFPISLNDTFRNKEGEELSLDDFMSDLADQKILEGRPRQDFTSVEGYERQRSQRNKYARQPESVESNPPALRLEALRNQNASEKRRKSYLSTRNYINGVDNAPDADPALQHHGPLLNHLLKPNGEWNDENIMALNEKFTAMGFHSILNPDNPANSAWNDTKVNEEYSGVEHFFQRLQAMAMGTDIIAKGDENEGRPWSPEQQQAMFNIFNPEEGEPLIKDFHFQDATVLNTGDKKNTSEGQRREALSNAVTQSEKTEIKDYYQEHGHGNLPSAFNKHTTPEAKEEALRNMESDGEFEHQRGLKKLAPWKISKGTAALLAQTGFHVAPDIDDAIKKNNRNGEPLLEWGLDKKEYSWDDRFYLTVDDEDNPGKQKFNPDFLGINDENSEASDEEKEAQLALLSQLINDKGQVKHLYNTDDPNHQILKAWGPNTLQGWDNKEPDRIGPPEGHDHVDKLPLTLDHASIVETLEKMAAGKFGTSPEEVEANKRHYNTGGIQSRHEANAQRQAGTAPEGSGVEAGEVETLDNEMKTKLDTQFDSLSDSEKRGHAGSALVTNIRNNIGDDAADYFAARIKAHNDELVQSKLDAEAAVVEADQQAGSKEDLDESEVGDAAVEEVAEEPVPADGGPVNGDKDGQPPISTSDGDESAWDALSDDEKKLLEEKKIDPAGYNSMNDPSKRKALQTKAEKQAEDEAGKDLDIPVIEDHLDKVMAAHFGEDWEKWKKSRIFDGTIDETVIDNIDRVVAHYDKYPKELDAAYKKEVITPLTTPKVVEEDDDSKEDLIRDYKNAYRLFTRNVSDPNGIDLDPANIPQDKNLLLRGIHDLQLQTRKKKELKVETKYRDKANDLSAFEQMPEGISSRMLTLRAKEAILHQMKYQYSLDSKGKSFMTEESQEAMQQVYNDILTREDDAGNKLIDMDTIWADIQKKSDEGDGFIAGEDGKTVHFLEQEIKDEHAEIKALNERHKALAEKITTEGLESLQYPINGHNILTSVDGKTEYEVREGGEYTRHTNGRLRDRLNGNLIDKDHNRLTKAPTVLGLEFANEEDEQNFNKLWNKYYQNAHKISALPTEAEDGDGISFRPGEMPSIVRGLESMSSEEQDNYSHMARVRDILDEKDDLRAEIMDNYGKKGFNSDWFKFAGELDSVFERPSMGVGTDGNELPLPQVINPNTGELEDGVYSPQLKAIINSSFYRTLLEDSVKANTNPLYGDHKQIKLRGKDYGIDENEPALQLIQPLEDSPLEDAEKGAAVLFTQDGGIYHVRSAASYGIPDDGPMSHQDFNQMTLMLQIADDMAKNPTAYSGDVANILKFPDSPAGTIEAGDQKPLARSPILRQQLNDSKSVKDAKRQQKEDSQASPTARFLASLGKYPKEVGEQTSTGRLLVALAGDLTQSLTGKRLIPTTQSQQHIEANIAIQRDRAEEVKAGAKVAEETGLLAQDLPSDPKTGKPIEIGSPQDPFAEWRSGNVPEVENPLGTIGGAVKNLGRFVGRDKTPPPEPSSQPPPTFPVETP